MDVEFGAYLLKTRERQLWGPQGPIDLDGRSVDVLRALLFRPQELVLKDEIFSAVWPGTAVGENTLQVHISALRKALGPELIETVHGRGYKYRGEPPKYLGRESGSAAAMGDRPLVAVLPFGCDEDDRALKSFSEAFTGHLLEHLSRFSLLSVMPHPVRPPQETGGMNNEPEAARASFVVSGDVRRSGSALRLAVKLQEARTRVLVWAEHYDRSMDDQFAVIDELSGTIAGRLNTRIESYMATRQAGSRPHSSYDHLIRGIWHFRLQTPEGTGTAEQLFRKARELNPANAEAVRWLSMRMTCLWLSRHKREHLEEGLALGRAAAELDPASATCQAALGFAQLWAEGAEKAASSFRKAHAANPNDGYMLADVGLSHLYAGRVADGLAVLDRAEQLSPFPSDWHSHYRSIAHFIEGRYADALPGLRSLPLGCFGLVYLMACHGHLGNARAIRELMSRVEEMGCDPAAIARDEPFADEGIKGHLMESVERALALAGAR